MSIFITHLLPIILMVDSIGSNYITVANFEKYNTTCESLTEINSTSSNLFFNRPADSSCDEDDNFTNTVTIGFLGAYGQAQVLLGALPLAVEAVNNDERLLPGKRLNYVAANIGIPSTSGFPTSKSSSMQAIRSMTEMKDNGAIAFIGPDDTCFPEALVAAAWNLPMISYDGDFYGSIYPTDGSFCSAAVLINRLNSDCLAAGCRLYPSLPSYYGISPYGKHRDDGYVPTPVWVAN